MNEESSTLINYIMLDEQKITIVLPDGTSAVPSQLGGQKSQRLISTSVGSSQFIFDPVTGEVKRVDSSSPELASV